MQVEEPRGHAGQAGGAGGGGRRCIGPFGVESIPGVAGSQSGPGTRVGGRVEQEGGGAGVKDLCEA